MMRNEKAIISTARQTGKPYLDSADIVIIGNGIAGLTAAIEARRLARDKHIVIITEQIHPTINTPALKQFAIGKLEREQLLAYPAGTERAERIHVVHAHVDEIHARSKYIQTSNGCGFGYDKLLIATGSRPQGLPAHIPGRDFDGVCTLHRLQDYLDLRRRLSEVSDAVVIGGGVHAIETVMGLLYWGIRVHWLIRGSTFMARMLDKSASEIVLERVRHAGCKVHTTTEVVGVVGRVGVVVGVITNHQEMIPCQLVLTCTGTTPVTTLADRCTLPIRQQHGILVDDQLHTSVPDIYAAGDVAALKNPQTGKYETRALWYAAVAQARTVAAVMTGHDELALQPFGVQWHATHLGDLSMLTVGSPLISGPTIVTLTDTGQGSYRRMAVMDDRLIGYLSLGPAQPDSLAIKQIIEEGHAVRDITKALLKGNFDARRYLSKHHKRIAQGVLTGQLRQLPEPTSTSAHIPRVQLMPFTGALPAARHNTDALHALSPSGDTEALTGVARRRTDDLYNTPASTTQQPSPAVIEEEDEISPFTGTLPSLPSKVVESTLVPLPLPVNAAASTVSGNTPSRSLWSYANKG
jgi:NAD(P)H-nitrite reductase large subunit